MRADTIKPEMVLRKPGEKWEATVLEVTDNTVDVLVASGAFAYWHEEWNLDDILDGLEKGEYVEITPW